MIGTDCRSVRLVSTPGFRCPLFARLVDGSNRLLYPRPMTRNELPAPVTADKNVGEAERAFATTIALIASLYCFASSHDGDIGTIERDFQVVILDGLGFYLLPGKQPDVCVSCNEHTVSACDEKLLGVQFFEKGDVSFYARLCPLPHDLRQLLFCLVVSWSGACYECENHQRKSGDDFCR